MKKFALGMLAAVAMTGSAVAADMAPRYAKAPPPAPVVVYNWTGCYIGGNIGGGWARTSQERTEIIGVGLVVPPTNYGSSDGSDFVGGAQIGCDYQFAGNWVLGIQGMYNYARIDSSHFLTAFPTFRSDIETKDIFTVTGRLGYLFTPQLLGYIKGGGAWTRSDYVIFQPGGVLVSEQAFGVNRSGWTVGGGLEWMFAPGWSVFGEYNYMDFGHRDVAFTTPVIGAFPDRVRTKLEVSTALVGVNYKFNWGGPVVARY
ncbi:outer membrane protein [Bradyrhizobium sp. AUGA SZCCT0160]|uniref:outer membrane protein n=1 Tax=Bradyrhizobium sp. AUGA SZCCT0160 TaxID=2807662 RepID=UPI001BA8ACA9|nr:outer membrane beta-barrel protein [Bradyrhizobium sp. AUGA SZCCT0160]MBR1193528.1 porin family protein [Bradyrhizobium sp. AUGA SZCCT0160]